MGCPHVQHGVEATAREVLLERGDWGFELTGHDYPGIPAGERTLGVHLSELGSSCDDYSWPERCATQSGVRRVAVSQDARGPLNFGQRRGPLIYLLFDVVYRRSLGGWSGGPVFNGV